MIKTKKMMEIEKRIGEPLEDFLRRRYSLEKTRMVIIGKELEVHTSTAQRLIKKSRIKKRNISEVRLPKDFAKHTKKELRQLYVQERLSTLQIAEEWGVSHPFISKLLKKSRIKIRNASEALLPKSFVEPTKKELRQLCVQEKLSPYQIAGKLDRSVCYIYKLLKKHNFNKIRGRCDDKEFRKKLVDELSKIRNKPVQKLSVRDFGHTKKEGKCIYSTPLCWYERKYHCSLAEARDKLLEDLYGIKVETLNRKIRNNKEFLKLLRKDETARNLAVAAVYLKEQAVDVEKIITDLYEGKFEDGKHLHKLLGENTKEIYGLIREGVTNLGTYLGDFSLGDRSIVPILIGQVITCIPEEKISRPLEERLVRILRTEYSPRFNENPKEVLKEIKSKIRSSEGKKKELYGTLYKHYQDILNLKKELDKLI